MGIDSLERRKKMLASVATQMHWNAIVSDAFESETDANSLRSSRSKICVETWGTFDTVEFAKIRPQDSRNPAIPWQTSATLTHSRISVMVKLNFLTSIVLTRRTPNQLDAIANGKKIRVVFSWLSES